MHCSAVEASYCRDWKGMAPLLACNRTDDVPDCPSLRETALGMLSDHSVHGTFEHYCMFQEQTDVEQLGRSRLQPYQARSRSTWDCDAFLLDPLCICL